MQRGLKNAIQKIAILEEEIRMMAETLEKNEIKSAELITKNDSEI